MAALGQSDADASTAQQTLRPGGKEIGDWRPLELGPGESHLGATPETGARVLAALVHISDSHVCDAQSPLRAPYIDRLTDPHSPMAEAIGAPVGGYRAHEALTPHILEATVRSINQLERGPVTGAKLNAVVATGDLTDNAQQNELDWVQLIAEGGVITPDSGDPNRYQGPGGSERYDPNYWHPDGTPAGEQEDNPRARYGFPVVPGLFDAARASYRAAGFQLPWFAVNGNHDLLVQGTITANPQIEAVATARERAIGFHDQQQMLQFLSQFAPQGPASWPDARYLEHQPTTADQNRAPIWPDAWGKRFEHIKPSAPNNKYFSARIGELLVLALDTVNPWGGWDGSIDRQQLDWLERNLAENPSELILVLSHHPVTRLENDYSPLGKPRRIGADPIVKALTDHGGVLLWLAGHRHRHSVQQVGDLAQGGFWHVETSSLIDWPQQYRTVEITQDSDQRIQIALTVFDHSSAINPIADRKPVADFDPASIEHLAGLARLLAANDWQRRAGSHALEILAGNPSDRNLVLELPARKRAGVLA
jgi:metallophosphoesterase (TIGR03767 family)